jgi:hypothetical protein
MVMKKCFIEGVLNKQGFIERSNDFYQQQAQAAQQSNGLSSAYIPAYENPEREYSRDELRALFNEAMIDVG